MGHRGPVLKPRYIGPGRAQTQIPFIHSFVHSFIHSFIHSFSLPNILRVL